MEKNAKCAIFKIVNVVATASLNEIIDLHRVQQSLPGETLYDPFYCHPPVPAYFKMQCMKGKVSIFASGRMISVGTDSESDAWNELELTRKSLAEKFLTKAREINPKTQNIVVSANLKENIDLEKLAANSEAVYEPEQFPAAILRITEPYKASILIFASGKVVITGLKSSEQIDPTIQALVRLID